MNAIRRIDDIADNYTRHVGADYVGLWQIAGRVRDDMRLRDNKEVKEKTLLVVRRLLEHGLHPGDYVHPRFEFWKESDPDSIIKRIDKEWNPSRGDPNLGEPICWFDALPGTKHYANHRMRHV